jgi:hypothetical protein
MTYMSVFAGFVRIFDVYDLTVEGDLIENRQKAGLIN